MMRGERIPALAERASAACLDWAGRIFENQELQAKARALRARAGVREVIVSVKDALAARTR